MLSEIVLILAGHPSSYLEEVPEGSSNPSSSPASVLNALHASVHAKEHIPLHPGERVQLNYLATLAHKRSTISGFARSQLEQARRRALKQASVRPGSRRQVALGPDDNDKDVTSHLAPLCGQILRYLEQYDDLVVDMESRILRRDAYIVGARSYVSLATLRAEMQVWDSRLAALSQLVETLIKGPQSDASEQEDEQSPRPAAGLQGWTGGLLIDLLSRMTATGVTRVASMMESLRDAVEDSWKILLKDWICEGVANGSPISLGSSYVSQGPDALVEQDKAATEQTGRSSWRLRPWSLPSSISSVTADAILYIGRAISRVKTHSDMGHLPAALVASHAESIRSDAMRPSRPHAFAKAVLDIKQDVGEWLWRNVLTDQAVLSALNDLYVASLFSLSYFPR